MRFYEPPCRSKRAAQQKSPLINAPQCAVKQASDFSCYTSDVLPHIEKEDYREKAVLRIFMESRFKIKIAAVVFTLALTMKQEY